MSTLLQAHESRSDLVMFFVWYQWVVQEFVNSCTRCETHRNSPFHLSKELDKIKHFFFLRK